MGNWFSIITWVVSNLPAVIKIVSEIKDLITGLPKSERKACTEELAAAFCVARTSGDHAPIIDVTSRFYGGVGYPSDVLKD